MRARAHAWVYRACVRARLVFYSVFLTESCRSVMLLFVMLSTDPFKGGRVAKVKGDAEGELLMIRLNELRFASNEVRELQHELRAAKRRVKAAQAALVEVNLDQRDLPLEE